MRVVPLLPEVHAAETVVHEGRADDFCDRATIHIASLVVDTIRVDKARQARETVRARRAPVDSMVVEKADLRAIREVVIALDTSTWSKDRAPVPVLLM